MNAFFVNTAATRRGHPPRRNEYKYPHTLNPDHWLDKKCGILFAVDDKEFKENHNMTMSSWLSPKNCTLRYIGPGPHKHVEVVDVKSRGFGSGFIKNRL